MSVRTAGETGRRLPEHIRAGRWRVVHDRDGLRILTGTAYPALAHTVASLLGNTAEEVIRDFGGGEFVPQIGESVRRKDVFIIQPTGLPDPSRYQMELTFMLDAARRASAGEMTAMVPYLGFSRQDRQTDQQNPLAPRESVSAKVVVDQIFGAGAHRLAVVDVHNDVETAFTNMPFDNLHVSQVMIPVVRGDFRMSDLMTLSPDFGGGKRAERWRDMLGAYGFAMAYKKRTAQGVKTTGILEQDGAIVGKDILLIDDILGTGKSIENATRLAHEAGARSVHLAVAHGLFLESDGIQALARLKNVGIGKIYVSDTIPQRPEIVADPSVHVVSVAPVLAEAIKRIHNGQSIHGMN